VKATEGKVVIPYSKYKLANGLVVLLHEDHSDPVVDVMVTYKVGSARESMGKSGFAHFFEHMMFEGSKHLADKEHFKIVSTAGGDMNGFTERDKTTYFETLPSNYLETGLYLESDRMGFLLDSLTTKKFEIQRATVKNEKSQNVENQPYAIAFEEEINKILGLSAVTNVNLDATPKQLKKGEKVRYEGWQGFEQMLKNNKSIVDFIPTIKEVHDYFEKEYKGLIQFNYTPNFLTVSCKYPNSRSRTIIFIRLKKNAVMFEYAGKNLLINSLAEFTESVKQEIKIRFNELSEKKK